MDLRGDEGIAHGGEGGSFLIDDSVDGRQRPLTTQVLTVAGSVYVHNK